MGGLGYLQMNEECARAYARGAKDGRRDIDALIADLEENLSKYYPRYRPRVEIEKIIAKHKRGE